MYIPCYLCLCFVIMIHPYLCIYCVIPQISMFTFLKFVYLGIYYVILLYYGIMHVYLIHVLEQKMSAF